MIPRWHRAELVVKALQTGDPDLILLYLLNDARTKSLEQAEQLIDAWLADPRNERVARVFGLDA
jgi:alpha-galactosidase/6-phospho-beta-glucosidase family protein